MAEPEEFKKFAEKLGRRPYRQHEPFSVVDTVRGLLDWKQVSDLTRAAIRRTDGYDALVIDRVSADNLNVEARVKKLATLDGLRQTRAVTDGVVAENDTIHLKNRGLLTDAQRRELALKIETERYEKNRNK